MSRRSQLHGDGGGRHEVGETALVRARSEAAALVDDMGRGRWAPRRDMEAVGCSNSGAATGRHLFCRRRSCFLEGGGPAVALSLGRRVSPVHVRKHRKTIRVSAHMVGWQFGRNNDSFLG